MTDERTFSTPMMQQFMSIKKQYSDCLLFFRLGDFYELFLDDAIVGAKALDITLTRRPRGKDGDIPMAGVPHHASDIYIAKLVKQGFKIAICEQVSEPDSKGIVEREVVRIVTPGTILDEKTLNKKENNYTISLSFGDGVLGLAAADLSTGDFQSTEVYFDGDFEPTLASELLRFNPSECILSDETYMDHTVLRALSKHKGLNMYSFPAWEDHSEDADHILKKHFKVKTLAGFGIDTKEHAKKAAAALIGYLRHTQKDHVDHIGHLRSYTPDEHVVLDHSTIINLELFSTIRDGDVRGSLINVLDETHSAMGARLMRTWIRQPLTKKSEILERQAVVEALLEQSETKRNLAEELKKLYDIERIVSRLTLGLGNAPDLNNLKSSLIAGKDIQKILKGIDLTLLRKLNKEITNDIDTAIALIDENISDDPSIDIRHGGIIKQGLNKELDNLRTHIDGGKNWMADYEEQERANTGINSLKVKFNKVFGFYIEISRANLDNVPSNYIRKQTMVNAERFITPELKVYEHKILTAEEKIFAIEYTLFLETVQKVLLHTTRMQKAAGALATIDCLLSLATVAEKRHYARPTMTENGTIDIHNGRHPVVETMLDGEQFVPNDVTLNKKDHQLILITGPNMAGKSVFMRQVALIVLMAHIGSFVPAEEAEISMVDRIFVRSGASDIITSGLSTFMVEMVETAHILNHATNKSLIIMDEIGRGTSTYDGISIAWAVAEYLVTEPQVAAKTLFATHYHELQELTERYPNKIKSYQVSVDQNNGDPIFLHKVLPGGASHSFGVAVAKLAGVPKKVVEKALGLLGSLEKRHVENSKAAREATPITQTQQEPNHLQKKLAAIDLNSMTPLDALNTLKELQDHAND